MPSTKEIKRRITSVKSTKKITKAMELVSASKMKRAVSQTLSSRLYASYSWEVLTSLSNRLEEITHPFFTNNGKATSGNSDDKNLIVLITSNRGLCGGYNSQIIKKTILMLKENTSSEKIDIISVGKKGDSAMRKTGQNIVATFAEMPDINLKVSDIVPISTLIINEFKNGNYKNVYIAYTDFVSALTQKPKIRKILPISKEDIREEISGNLNEKLPDKKSASASSYGETREIPYLFEGDTDKLLESLAEKLTRMQIYQMILESSASEQSSRMVAMKNANEAAGEMIDDLTLVFNKARQAGITREISEISAGMASVG
ncbi:MAG: ATP synthase F1 subunit gamma [Candidatus Paceibacterota bacterium]|jgi:F-type H+-transporting ATPase subunit gamma